MRKSTRFTAIAVLTALTLATGCAKDKDPGNMNGSPDLLEPDNDPPDMAKPPRQDGGGPIDPNPEDPDMLPPQPVADYTGVCIKTAVVNLGGKDVLPAPVTSTINILSNLQDAPGEAIVQILIDTNIPSVSAWLADPANATVKGILTTLLNSFIKDFYANVVPPEVNQVIGVLDNIGDLLQTIQFKSQMAFRNYDPATHQAESQELFYGVTFTYDTTTELFKFPPATLALTKIVGGKKITNITPKNAPQADYTDALIDGGNLQTFPMGDIFLQAIQKMILKPLTGFDTFGDALASVVPCDDISSDPTNIGVVACKAALKSVVEAALSPIKDFKFENVVVGRATATGFEVSTTQPTVDYKTSRITGTQPITFTNAFGATVPIQAPYECLRIDTPEYAVTW